MRIFLRKLGLFSKWILLSNAAVLSAYFVQAVLPTSYVGISVAQAAENGIEVWWPSQGAELTGVQPLQVMLQNKNINDYEMYWSAGGDQVKMDNSNEGYPHKEAKVDFTGWTWNSSNTYNLQFIAKDKSGNELGRTSVEIKHTPESQKQAQTSTSVAKQDATRNIEIWWPSENAVLTGTQPIKAMLQNTAISDYDMFWSVGGDQILMKDSTEGYPHKEAKVDFTNWNWKGVGPYQITLTAKEKSGSSIAQKAVNITTSSQTTQPVATVVQPVTQTVAPVTSTVEKTVATVTNTIGTKLYVDPNNPALAQAQAWKSSRPGDAAIMEKMGSQSTAIWLGGWNGDVQGDVSRAIEKATSQNAIATFIAYNIPGRDCGQYSAGGVNSKSEYLSWIRKISSGLGNGKAILVLEPDGVALIDCLSNQGKYERLSTISEAIDILKANANTKVYIDAGHGGWINPEEMANRLKTAGISKASGFALNVSNFVSTSENTTYGEKISQNAGGAHFIIDTSRNGSGSNGEWCNPSGRSLGQAATFNTGNSKVDALLWLKRPGESDGNCNGGPSAGTWWPEYALDLAKRAGY